MGPLAEKYYSISPYVYCVNNGDGNIGGVTKGSDGNVHINATSDQLFVHEIKHVTQSLAKEGLIFKNGKLQNAGTTNQERLQMEVNAYKAQFSFLTGSVPIGLTFSLYSPKEISPTMIGNMWDRNGNIMYHFLYQNR